MAVSITHKYVIGTSVFWLMSLSPFPLCADEQVSMHSGTGFFINPEYIITNEHVVHDGCAQIIIQDRGHDWARAQIIATDIEHDLAVLHSPKWPRDIATLRSDIDELKAGDRVVAVGFPIEALMQGKDYEIATAKIINTNNSYGNPWMLQFSHAIKLGYSGGPLLDGVGKVVGVVKGIAKLYETYTVGGRTSEQHFVGEVDEAINLVSLEQFLMANNVSFHTAKDQDERSNGLDFTINVQCVDKNDNAQ